MKPTIAETIRTQNNIPLPIECLIMNHTEQVNSWDHTYMHYHEYIEILYPLMGDYGVLVNGEETCLREHSLFVINAMIPHATRSLHNQKQTLLCIKFMPQILYSSKQSVTELEYTIPYVFQQMNDKHLFDREILEDTIIPGEFKYIQQETERDAFGYELALRSGVLRIFTWILRYWHEHADHPELLSPNNSTSQMIHSIREYVEQNYTDATLTAAAESCGLSYSYFSRVFNRYMNMSFSDYVNIIRTNQAMRLLATTDMSITDVAYAVGFSSTSYFIQTFRKHKHISPNRFRKMCCEEDGQT